MLARSVSTFCDQSSVARRSLWIPAMLLALMPSLVMAQSTPSDAAARRLFDAGRRAYDEGRWAEAEGYFDGAFRMSQLPALQYNIGLAADRAGHSERALEAFRAYLAANPEGDRADEVQVRIEVLEGASSPPPAGSPPVEPEAASPALTLTSGEAETGNRAESTSIVEEWWFWTVIGVVVVGAAAGVTAAVLASQPSPVEGPLEGQLGGVVYALGSW